MKISPPPYGFSWSATTRAEKRIQDSFDEAKKAYSLKTLDIRKRAGQHLKHIRTNAGISRATMARLTGICSEKSSSGVFIIIEEPTAQKSYGIERMEEISILYGFAIEQAKNMPPVKRGRKPLKTP